MQDMTQHQRMATFIAAQSHNLFPMMERFAARLERMAPGCSAGMGLQNKTARFELAMAASEVCKRVDRLSGESAWVGRMRGGLEGMGFTTAQMPAVRGAFLDAMRETVGTAWTSEIERDWSEVMGRCFGACEPGAARMRMAA